MNRASALLVLPLALAALAATAAPPAFASTVTAGTQRLDGADRYSTAVVISRTD